MDFTSNVDATLILQPTIGEKRFFQVSKADDNYTVASLPKGEYRYWEFNESESVSKDILPLLLGVVANEINYAGEIQFDADEDDSGESSLFGRYKFKLGTYGWRVYKDGLEFGIGDERLRAEERFKEEFPNLYSQYEFKVNIVGVR